MAKPKRKVSKGTGQKYQTESTPQTSTARPQKQGYPESSLRRKLENFSSGEQARPEVTQALSLYFEKEIDLENEEDLFLIEELFVSFVEWFTYDYQFANGKHLVEMFQEKMGSQLSSTQKEILAHWQANKRLRLLEVQEIEPGVRLITKDLLNGERLELRDIAASQHATLWEILLIRTEWSADRICFAPEVYPLRPRNRLEMLETAQKLWGDYQQQHPQNSLLDFYRDHSLDLILAARRIMREEDIPPTPITEEGHEVCFSTAYFDILSNPEEVAALLNAAEEFELTDSDDDDPGIMNFDWLKCGRSNVPEAEERPAKSVIVDSMQLSQDGTKQVVALGEVSLWEKEVWLNVISMERLEAGKLLLAEILGEHIRYLDGQDEIVTWQEKMEPDDDEDLDDFEDEFEDDDFEDDDFEDDDEMPDELEVLDGDEVNLDEEGHEVTTDDIAQIQAQWLAKQAQEWLDETIPALNNLTPRQAAQDSQERPQLIMLLKDFEFSNAQLPNRQSGSFDVAFLRQELSITNEDMLA